MRGKPTLIVASRSDELMPVNNSARAYTAFNRVVEGGSSQLSCAEVFNAQHFDAFLPFSRFDTRFVPLDAYFNQAMNSTYARLTANTALTALNVPQQAPPRRRPPLPAARLR